MIVPTRKGPRWLTYRLITLYPPVTGAMIRYNYVLEAWKEWDETRYYPPIVVDDSGLLVSRLGNVPWRNGETGPQHRRRRDREAREALSLINGALGTAYLDWASWQLLDYLATPDGKLDLYVDYPLELPAVFVERK